MSNLVVIAEINGTPSLLSGVSNWHDINQLVQALPCNPRKICGEMGGEMGHEEKWDLFSI